MIDATCQEWGCGVGRVATGCGKNIHLQSARDESIKYLFTASTGLLRWPSSQASILCLWSKIYRPYIISSCLSLTFNSCQELCHVTLCDMFFPLLFPLKTVRICPHWFSGWLWWISAPLRGVLCPGWIIEAPPRRRRRWPRCDRGDDAAWDQILIPTALKPLGRTILVGHCMIVRNCGSAWNRGLDSLWEISREY